MFSIFWDFSEHERSLEAHAVLTIYMVTLYQLSFLSIAYSEGETEGGLYRGDSD